MRGADVIRLRFPQFSFMVGPVVLVDGDDGHSPPFPALCRSWQTGMGMVHGG